MSNSEFKQLIWDFYKKNNREFSWRKTHNPYKILVSELMLQQTQASRVVSKFEAFIKRFPDFQRLNQATTAEVLQLWQGLGYNRRALYLKRIAEKVIMEHKGKLLIEPQFLQTLPGIGPYTAKAIYVFVKNEPEVFLETNIRRVFIHHFFGDKNKVSDKEIIKLVEQTTDRQSPREWYYALMDYGAYLAKTIPNPNKKSSRYTKQSKFEGSLRQTRGKILKLLLVEKSLNKKMLEEKIQSEHFIKAFEQLEKEGFIQNEKQKIRLTS
jgi:A/G-specific adenine glycosylase